jgi:hypothetical protein
MEAKKPKGFGEFDNLMRKLVKVPPSALKESEVMPIPPTGRIAVEQARRRRLRQKRKRK